MIKIIYIEGRNNIPNIKNPNNPKNIVNKNR